MRLEHSFLNVNKVAAQGMGLLHFLKKIFNKKRQFRAKNRIFSYFHMQAKAGFRQKIALFF